ncbi:MAG: alpha/beta hydrolase [Paracoccaceae bacterium]|jgi:pimeloyl-ACP methyl ester carboxylesterase|nr:alpha/beta hydrolase [Paracoccaceae bacterium]
MFDWKPGEMGWIKADGKRLEATCYGPAPGNAPTIVMLHEGLGCVALWRDFPEKIQQATGCGVFVYSRAGYGRSDPAELPKSTDFMDDEALDVLPEILSAIGADRFILMGHSDGATISAIYTGGVQDKRIRGLILMAPHFFNEDISGAEIAKAKQAFETTDWPEKMAKYHNDPKATFMGWAGPWLDAEFQNDWNVAECIDYWRIPVLAIQGRQDQYGTLAQLDEIEARTYCPADIVVLEDCQHSAHVDQPEKVLEAISEYVARLVRLEAEEVSTG